MFGCVFRVVCIRGTQITNGMVGDGRRNWVYLPRMHLIGGVGSYPMTWLWFY